MLPTSIQFEMTYACNNNCTFCYNPRQVVSPGTLTVKQVKQILNELDKLNVFSINFNGGEPLLHKNFFEIARFAKRSFDIHLNTNATLINNSNIEEIAELFPAICTSVHGNNAALHDTIVMRNGAFDSTIDAIKLLHAHGISVAVNITLFKENLIFFEKILELLKSLNVMTVLVSKVVTTDKKLEISNQEMLNCIDILMQFNEMHNCFGRVAFPKPIQLCGVHNKKIKHYIKKYNVPCMAGKTTARINPYGFLTPCTMIETPVLGCLKDQSFEECWQSFMESGWTKTDISLKPCSTCKNIAYCGSGCIT